jgi:hypothetical protein
MNPFSYGDGTEAIDSATRISKVRRMTEEQCLAARRIPGVQKTVRAAIDSRLRRLQTEHYIEGH